MNEIYNKYHSAKNVRRCYKVNPAKDIYSLSAEEFFILECSRENRFKHKRSFLSLSQGVTHSTYFLRENESTCQTKRNKFALLSLNSNTNKPFKKKSQSNVRVTFTDHMNDQPLKKVIDVESYKKFNATNTFTLLMKDTKRKNVGSGCCCIF